MKIKSIVDEVFQDYKKISMFINFPKCTFKCLKDLNLPISICQNCEIAKQEDVEVEINDIITRYIKNDITDAIVCGGLEPLDSFDDLLELLTEFRKISNDDFVVYTGFDESEIYDKIALLSHYKNVIVKFGRFIPNQESHYDEILGVNLASPNQYAKIIGEKK
jgi:organic radical activating enzyme